MPLATGKLTYRGFAERIKAYQRERSRLLAPGADLMPEFYMYLGDQVTIVPMPPEAFSSRETKDRLASVALPLLIRGARPSMVAVQYDMWEVRFHVTTPEQRREVEEAYERMEYPDSVGPPSEHRDRIEVIQLHVLDAERHETYRAPYKRRRKGVQLGQWEDLGVDALVGLMIDPIKEAMR